MSLSDFTYYCDDCNQPFPFTVAEQMFYASKNIINPPNRCPHCRKENKIKKEVNKILNDKYRRLLTCQDCHQPFEFSYGEQQYYKERSLGDPTRCKDCREKRRTAPRSGTLGNMPGQPRQMYNTICADCGNQTQVPFEPRPGSAVYCRSCYPAHKRS